RAATPTPPSSPPCALSRRVANRDCAPGPSFARPPAREASVRRRQQETDSKTIELLSERLAFERTGVKLYDRIVRKVLDSRGGDGITDAEEVAEQLGVFRDEEKEHEEWLEDRIRELGSDPNEQTDRSVLVQEESKGIVDVVLESERPLPEMLHALLAAELV